MTSADQCNQYHTCFYYNSQHSLVFEYVLRDGSLSDFLPVFQCEMFHTSTSLLLCHLITIMHPFLHQTTSPFFSFALTTACRRNFQLRRAVPHISVFHFRNLFAKGIPAVEIIHITFMAKIQTLLHQLYNNRFYMASTSNDV